MTVQKTKDAKAVVELPADLTDIPLRNMRSGWCSDPSPKRGHDHCDPVVLNRGGSEKLLRCPCSCHEWLWAGQPPSARARASATVAALLGYDDPPGTQKALFAA